MRETLDPRRSFRQIRAPTRVDWKCNYAANIGNLMSPALLKLNQIAQGLLPWASGVSWFIGLSSSEKRSVLRGFHLFEAHIADERRA
jgi:hypothetical protein